MLLGRVLRLLVAAKEGREGDNPDLQGQGSSEDQEEAGGSCQDLRVEHTEPARGILYLFIYFYSIFFYLFFFS